MPQVTAGQKVYVAELVFTGEDGTVAERFWSLPYHTERGLRDWIRRHIAQRGGQEPYRARIAYLECVGIDTVHGSAGRPRKLKERPRGRPPLKLLRAAS